MDTSCCLQGVPGIFSASSQVFELDELGDIPFAPGRIVWKRSDMPDTLGQPVYLKTNTPSQRNKEWLLGEALTNIYVGQQR